MMVMCSGSSTGEAACPAQLDLVLGGVPDTPVLIGSGVTIKVGSGYFAR